MTVEKIEERDWVTFENESRKLFGVIHRPMVPGKRPAVLFCQGFEGNKCGKHRVYVTLAEKLVQLGFVVLRFDYRGYGDSEGDFQEVTIEGEISDILKAVEFLAHDEQVDKDRICLFARSLGGPVALAAAARLGTIKNIVLWAPVFSSTFWKDLWLVSKSPMITDQQKQAMSRFQNQIPNKLFLSQFFNLDIMKYLPALNEVPILLVHGERDAVVNIEHSIDYEKARQGAKGPTRFVRLPNMEHDFSHLQDQAIAFRETCEWLKAGGTQ